MKKIYAVFAATLFAVSMVAEPFFVRVNGSTDYAATNTGEQDYQGRTQYAALNITLAQGDKLTCFDQGSGTEWNIGVIDQYGAYQSFSTGNEALTCNAAGTYNVYIKMKMNDDMWYIEAAGGDTPGGGDNPGGGDTPGGGVEGNPRYYYKGWIDGADVEPSEYTLFDHGVAEIEFTQQAALLVLYQVDGKPGVQYMTPEWIDGPRHTTLSVDGNGGFNKWNCPLGTTKLYLYDNEDGTLEISADVIPGKKLADPQPEAQGVENTEVTEKTRKVMENGQLIIIRGEKRFDATGRQL